MDGLEAVERVAGIILLGGGGGGNRATLVCVAVDEAERPRAGRKLAKAAEGLAMAVPCVCAWRMGRTSSNNSSGRRARGLTSKELQRHLQSDTGHNSWPENHSARCDAWPPWRQVWHQVHQSANGREFRNVGAEYESKSGGSGAAPAPLLPLVLCFPTFPAFPDLCATARRRCCCNRFFSCIWW